MATYTFSALSDGAAIAFDPEQDDLVFDQTSISAADLAVTAEGDGVRVLVASGAQAGKSVLLQDVSLFQLATSNVSFANGSALLFGDNSTAQNDDAANRLTGGAGNDLLQGFGGADTINGGNGNDVIRGGAGNDLFSGNAGTDWVEGGAGNDTMTGGGGQDSFAFAEFGAANADQLTEFASGWDSLHFDASAFTALGAEGQLSAGDARFRSGAGLTSGQDADDRLIYNTTTRQLYYDADGSGSGGSQLVATLQAGATLAAADIHVFGSGGGDPGGDVIRGTEGDDSLVGTAGDDSMEGLGGNDTLDGLAGDDTMNGGLGDDVYFSENLADEFVPGDVLVDAGGTDTVITDGGTLPDGIENMLLRNVVFQTGATGNSLDNLIRNESSGEAFIDGAGGDDTLIGGGGFDFFTLSEGNDSVDGGGGGNWLAGGSIDFRTGTATPAGGGGTTVFVNISSAAGSNADDALIADDSGRALHGAGGNDTLLGGAGDDELSGDSQFELGEFIGGDSISGAAGDDSINGGDGDDTLEGGEGNDTFFYNLQDLDATGDYGIDEVDGGAGTDTLWIQATSDAVIDLSAGTMMGGGNAGSGSATLASMENVSAFGPSEYRIIGNGAANRIETGAPGSGADTLDGGGGQDTISGGTGADDYLLTQAPGAGNADVILGFASGEDELHLSGDAMPALGAGGQFAAGDARFRAGAGVNSGQDASDRAVYNTTTGQLWYDADGSGGGAALLIATLDGAPALAATDIEVIGAAEPPPEGIVGTEGNDTLTGTGGDDTIHGLGGNDAIQGQAGNDTILGGAGNDVFSGNSDTDWLEGGAGNDTITGGSGRDEFVFREYGSANADVLVEFAPGWDDLNFDGSAFSNLGANGTFASNDGRFYAAAGATAGHDASDRLVYDTSTGALYYDADGSGGGGAQLVATLQNGAALTASDITVI